jgi:hypothetical protein
MVAAWPVRRRINTTTMSARKIKTGTTKIPTASAPRGRKMLLGKVAMGTLDRSRGALGRGIGVVTRRMDIASS